MKRKTFFQIKIKRLSIFLIVILLLNVQQGFCEITKEVDDFDKSMSFSSVIRKNVLPFWEVSLSVFGYAKLKEKDCLLMFVRIESEPWFFSGDASIKIDNDSEQIIDIPFYNSNLEILKSGRLMSTGGYGVGENMREKILKAKNLTFRIYYSNHPSIDWEAPERVLAEWKEVMRREIK